MAKIEDGERKTRVVVTDVRPANIRVERDVHDDGDEYFAIRIDDVTDESTFARNRDQNITGLVKEELKAVRDCINVMLGEVPQPVKSEAAPRVNLNLKYAVPVLLHQQVYVKGVPVSGGILQKGDEFRYYKDSDTAYRVVSDPTDGPVGQKAAWVAAVLPPSVVAFEDDDGEID